MEKETDYKFEPIWVTILSLITFFAAYKCYIIYNSPSPFHLGLFIVLCCMPALLGLFILPMTFLMISGTPAIVLTDDYFIDNIHGLSIEWHDIAEMKVTARGQRAGNNLVINLKQPEKYFNTPIKSLLYKLRQLFTASDISIKLDFVAGKNNEIVQMANAYWTKQDIA